MNVGAVIGGVLGGLALLSATIICLVARRRRRLRKNNQVIPYSPSASSTEGFVSGTSASNLQHSNVLNAVPNVLLAPLPPGSVSTDPRSSGYSFSGLQGAYGYTGVRKTPLAMDQIQPHIVPISALSAIPPTSSIVAFAPTANGPLTAEALSEVGSPLPSYSEANLGSRPPKLRIPG